LVARAAPAVVGTRGGAIRALAIGLASAWGIAASTSIIPAGRASRALATTGSAPAIVLPSTASPIAARASPGAAIVVASLVVRVRILRGWLFEPVRH